ncbi:MAG: beta family protein [Candidatus Omnitrophota bacterium]
MKNILYAPIIKTGDAEMRGLDNLNDENKNGITPVFELTKSRKSKNIPQGDIHRRLQKIQDIFGNRRFILDLTSDPNSTNEQIEKLLDNSNGYSNWINFLVLLKNDFPKLIPTIQITDKGVKTEEEVYNRVKAQVELLDKHFTEVVYRFPLEHDYYKTDLEHITNKISNDKLICIIDAGFITQNKSGIYITKAKSIIADIKKYGVKRIILSATSFPRNPTQFGDEGDGEFNLEECSFFNGTKEDEASASFIYGDYATINPIRSDQAGGNGWVPRIDMPTEDVLFYYRSRKNKRELTYVDAYIRVARSMVSDQRYKNIKKEIKDCWGIEQIELAAGGTPEGLSPSFWISVRMNIHMTIRKKMF